jgi:hypothetical protein
MIPDSWLDSSLARFEPHPLDERRAVQQAGERVVVRDRFQALIGDLEGALHGAHGQQRLLKRDMAVQELRGKLLFLLHRLLVVFAFVGELFLRLIADIGGLDPERQLQVGNGLLEKIVRAGIQAFLDGRIVRVPRYEDDLERFSG